MNTPEYRKTYMSNFELDAKNNALLGIPKSKIMTPKKITNQKVHKTHGKTIPCFSKVKSNKLKRENESKKNEKKLYFKFIFFKWEI